MAKIESVDSGYPFKKPAKKRTAKNRIQGTHTFDSIVELYSTEESEQVEPPSEFTGPSNLEALIDEVHEAGEKLKSSVLLANITGYRNAVKSFLKYVISEMMEIDEKVSGTNILKKKRFTIIKVIDEKLESLVAEILRGQSEQLSILARIEEINGLIIDIIS